MSHHCKHPCRTCLPVCPPQIFFGTQGAQGAQGAAGFGAARAYAVAADPAITYSLSSSGTAIAFPSAQNLSGITVNGANT
jgi:hypothetical protein